MTILHMDGFDGYNGGADALLQNEYSNSGAPYNISTNGGRFGGGCLDAYWDIGTQHYLIKRLGGAYTDVWSGGAARMNSRSGQHNLFCFGSALGWEIGVSLGNDGIRVHKPVYSNGASTVMGSYLPGTVNWFIYHWIEVRAVLHATAGIIEVWVDGVRQINLTGINTKTFASAVGFDTIVVGFDTAGQGLLLDDWYILDALTAPNNTRLGDCRIATLVPTSDAGPNNGALSTGTTHWGVVDETQYNATDYTDLTNTTGQAEYFGMSDLPANAQSVKAVKATGIALKTDAATMNVQNVIKNGGSGTEVVGASFGLTTSNSKITPLLRDTDPDGAAWTPTTVNAAIVGVKVL